MVTYKTGDPRLAAMLGKAQSITAPSPTQLYQKAGIGAAEANDLFRQSVERQKAASTSGMGPSGYTGGGGSSGGAVAAPVSTLASLPKSALLDSLIKSGLIKEGMPPEQALAILAFAQMREGVPINVAELMKQVSADYAKTSGDILTSGQDWMEKLMGTAYNPNDPNARMFADDPIFSDYAGGMAQLDEVADANEATDLAWFRKNQEAQEQYYNDMMTAISTGTLPIGEAAAGGGGGGGGGGRGGRGGGGYGGGGGGGGDNWSDPRTTASTTEQLQARDTANISWNNPEFYDKYVRDQLDPEHQAFNLDLFSTSGQDPQGVLQGMAERGTELQDFQDLRNEYDVNNLAWDAGLVPAARRELGAYNSMAGFDPESGLVPGTNTFPTGDTAMAAMAANPNFMEEWPRQQQLATQAYDPGEIRRTAYESMFDKRRIQELLGMVPQAPEPEPAPPPPPSSISSSDYNPINPGISYNDPNVIQTAAREVQNTPEANLAFNEATGTWPWTPVTDDPNAQPPQPQVLNSPQPQGPLETHEPVQAFNVLSDYDPEDPLRNVRLLLQGGHDVVRDPSKIEDYFRGAYSELPSGQRAAVNTYLQQRGIDTPEGTAENYEARRNNRQNVPTAPGSSGRTGLQGLAAGWYDRLRAGQNKQSIIGAAMSNPAMFQNLMNVQPEEAGEPIDFDAEDINRAFASSAVTDKGVRYDVKELLRGWQPTESEWDRSHTDNLVTGEEDFHPETLNNRYWVKPFAQEVIDQNEREMGFINEDLPIVLAANTNVAPARYRDTSVTTGTATDKIGTTQYTYDPDLALELTGWGDLDEITDFSQIDPMPDVLPDDGLQGNYKAGAGSGGRRPQVRSSGSRVATKVQPKTSGATSGLLAALRRAASSSGSGSTVKRPVIKKPGGAMKSAY